MRRFIRSSPMRLAVCAGLSSVFAVSFLLLEPFTLARYGHLPPGTALWHRPWLLLMFTLPLVSGMALSLWARSQLQKGVERDVWTEAQLAPLRRVLVGPVWMWLYLAGVGLYIALLVRNSSQTFTIYIAFLPLQMLIAMGNTMKRQQAKSNAALNLRTSAPLRSEHWGEMSQQGRAQ